MWAHMAVCNIKQGAQSWQVYTACDVNMSHGSPSLHCIHSHAAAHMQAFTG